MQDKVQGYFNVCKGDYDDRTALHIACSEGHFPIVQYFIENGFFKNILIKDRWKNTPLDDAIRVKSKFIEKYLKKKLCQQGIEFLQEQKNSDLRITEQKVTDHKLFE